MATTVTSAGPRITRYQDWDISEEKFAFMDSAVKTKNGGLASGFQYDSGKLRLKLPKMRAPFGLQSSFDGKGFNLQLSFDETPASQELLSKFRKLDEYVLQAGIKNASTWFPLGKNGKPLPNAVIEEKFYPSVREPSKEGYQPSIKVKLPCTRKLIPNAEDPTADPVETEVFDCRLYDQNKNQLPIDDENLAGGCHVSMLVGISSIWSTSTGFGVTLKAEQIMVFPNDNVMPTHCLLDLDSGDEAGEAVQHAPIILDSDDDEAAAPVAPSVPVVASVPVVPASVPAATSDDADEDEVEPKVEVKKAPARQRKAPVATAK